MTRLEQALKRFQSNGLSEEERQMILTSSEPPISFVKIAKEILDGCFIIESKNKKVKIFPTMVEMYYHEEDGSIQDPIVYHRNKKTKPSLPFFDFGILHNHQSGIDITFENDGKPQGIKYRASALIRDYRIVDGISNESLGIHTLENRPTYLAPALLGQFSIFDGYQIKWSDTERETDKKDIFVSQRIMEKRDHDGEEITEAQRKWNFSLKLEDRDTNTVYLSEWLNDAKEGFPTFFKQLTDAFKANGITWETLTKEETKDYWVRDFMPIQLSDCEFLKYKYDPDYLQSEKYKNTITNCNKACENLGIKCRKTDKKIDGGNVVICGDKVVMTDKVLQGNDTNENDKEFMSELEEAFGGRKVIFIPWTNPETNDPDSGLDVYGHADGFVKYAGDNRILMFAPNKKEAKQIKEELSKNGFEITEMDFSEIPVENQDPDKNWAYINFLQVGNKIFMPSFEGLKENEIARRYIKAAFPYCDIIPIEMSDIVKEGGALHCLTWNIKW